jgi:hypothetical protein
MTPTLPAALQLLFVSDIARRSLAVGGRPEKLKAEKSGQRGTGNGSE